MKVLRDSLEPRVVVVLNDASGYARELAATLVRW
jgi:hypothetical protein